MQAFITVLFHLVIIVGGEICSQKEPALPCRSSLSTKKKKKKGRRKETTIG